MTTIIVVVVVALVFFVAVCVVAFMIWKREAEMRTDSIRAIEENLERLTQEMSPEQERQGFAEREAAVSYMDSLIEQSAAGRSSGRKVRSRRQDPFEWVRENGEIVRSSSVTEDEKPFRMHPTEISGDITVSETADVQEPSDEHNMHDVHDMHDEHDDPDGSDSATLKGESGEEVCRKKQALTEMQKMLKELDVPEPENLTEMQNDTGPAELSDGNAEADPEIREPGDEDEAHEEQHDEKENYEISLDFIDEMDTDSEQEQMPAARMGYDVGRSGRKYTASELEKLIKE